MIRWHPKYLFFLGSFFVILGVVIPFLIIMDYLELTMFLNFFSFIISLVGMFLGIIGAAYYVRNK